MCKNKMEKNKSVIVNIPSEIQGKVKKLLFNYLDCYNVIHDQMYLIMALHIKSSLDCTIQELGVGRTLFSVEMLVVCIPIHKGGP